MTKATTHEKDVQNIIWGGKNDGKTGNKVYEEGPSV
jgi:hypothetical protein